MRAMPSLVEGNVDIIRLLYDRSASHNMTLVPAFLAVDQPANPPSSGSIVANASLDLQPSSSQLGDEDMAGSKDDNSLYWSWLHVRRYGECSI